MEFLLQPLSRTFAKLIEDEKYERFPLFAFVLATEANGEIFPDLLKYYGQLHTLTGPHMLVFAPGVDTNEVPGEELSTEDIAYLMRQFAEFPDFADQKARFLRRQMKDAYLMAKLCGIPRSDLPCILFFASLKEPQSYVRWDVKNADAQAIVRDFESITDRIEAARQAGKDDLLREIEALQGELRIRPIARSGFTFAGNFLTAVITALAVKGAGG
ncbi:MAG: hypothetical protein GX573_15615 [Chloroflexi bacterium]|nr:hypothetical protein [Chloroflexota bacterium]